MKSILSKIVWLFIAAPVVYLAITWKKIPPIIALHFDLRGNPDRFGSKNELITVSGIMVGLSIALWFLLTNIHRIDPKKQAVENKVRLERMAFAVVIFLSAILFMIIYNSVKGNFDISIGWIFSGVGLLFAVIGNYMPNLKPNYFAGLRLPWTLESPENWKKTHAYAGKWWFVGGLLIAVICLFTPPVIAFIVFIVGTIAITVIPSIYSYNLYKKDRAAGKIDSGTA